MLQIMSVYQRHTNATNYIIKLRKLNNSLLNKNWVKTESKKEIKAFLGFNKNKNITHPNI